MQIDIQKIYVPSQDLVAREIGDQMVIIPITLENLDFEDAIYTFNESGREIWQRLDKHLPLFQIIDELHQEYEASKEKITAEVTGLIAELIKKKIVQVYES